MSNAQKQRLRKSFETEQSGLFAFIRAKIRSLEEAEDLLQDVYVQALSSLNALSAIDNLTGWLYTVARNRIIDWYRKKRLPTISIDASDENGMSLKEILAAEIPESADESAQESLFRAAITAIEALPERQKTVFIQQVIEGRKFREIAEETEEPVNILIARKQYAIRFLRNRLTKDRQK
ncbi:MAG TPA: RNA polymerase sigma factor [Bacteroidetes bacterium]|nr:RNA polymerase sigma factor [Bacteroidota bacterium]